MRTRIGRLAVEGWPPSSIEQARSMLNSGLRRLPSSVEYLVGPGGYVTVLDPVVGSLPSGWSSTPESLEEFRPIAERVTRDVVSGVPDGLRSKARYFSFGIDVRDTNQRGDKHAELVVVAEMSTGRTLVLTAKTYPTEDQTRTLIRAVRWETHLWLPGNGDRVLVLGCHDLNVYNNRAFTNAAKDKGGQKFTTLSLGREIFSRFDPTHILHHPHATDIANTWRGAWSGVMEQHPRLVQGVSGIGHPKLRSRENDDIEVVLAATQVPDCASIDVVVMGNASSMGRQADVIPADLDRLITPEEAQREYEAEMRLYERGMKEWEYFKTHGVRMHPKARRTKPSPPSKPHKKVRGTPSNTCRQTTVSLGEASGKARASGAMGAASVVPAAIVGALLGAGAMHFAKRR